MAKEMNIYARMEMHEKWKLFLVTNPKHEAPLFRIVCAEDSERAVIESEWPGAEADELIVSPERAILYDVGTESET